MNDVRGRSGDKVRHCSLELTRCEASRRAWMHFLFSRCNMSGARRLNSGCLPAFLLESADNLCYRTDEIGLDFSIVCQLPNP